MRRLRLPRNKKKFERDIQFLVIYFEIENPFTDNIPGNTTLCYSQTNFVSFFIDIKKKSKSPFNYSGYYWMVRFLQDRNYKLLTDVEASLISGRIMRVQDFLDESKEEIKLYNDDELLDSGSRLLMLEMLSFIIDKGITLTLVVSFFFGIFLCQVFFASLKCGLPKKFLLQICYNADRTVFKPIVFHEGHVPQDTIDIFRSGLYFKRTDHGIMTKDGFDFVLDCVAQ